MEIGGEHADDDRQAVDHVAHPTDLPGAEKLAARMRKAMPAALVGDGGQQPPQQAPDPAQQAMIQTELKYKEASAAEKAAAAQDKTASAHGKQLANAAAAYELGHKHMSHALNPVANPLY